MHARFRAQPTVGIFACELDGGALDTSNFSRRVLDDFRLETSPLTPTQIHAQQHICPVLRFGPTRASLHIEECIARVLLTAEHALKFQARDLGFQLLQVAFDFD